MLYCTVHSQLGFGMQFFFGLIGLCFIVADFTTEDIPLWGSVACVLVIPWGITVTLLLKTHMMMRLLKMFNVWYLLSQVAAMVVCIGYVSARPFMVCMVLPTLIASVLSDAFPREHRRRVTAFSFFILVSFSVAFDISLLASLVPVDDSLSFTINSMEFSGKAIAFGCSCNLLFFAMRSIGILIFYPNCLVIYTTPLKSILLNPIRLSKVKMARMSSGTSITFSDMKNQKGDQNAEGIYALFPLHEMVLVNTKETLAAKCFGEKVNAMLWKMAKNPFAFVLSIPGAASFLPLLYEDEERFPFWIAVFTLLAMFVLFPSFFLMNTYLLDKLMRSFQVWFLIVMASGLLLNVFFTTLDIRLFGAPVLIFGLGFSLLLDAYPGSGRFLAGIRFYTLKLTVAVSIICILLLSESQKNRFFEEEVGQLTFSGAALTITFALNLVVFGVRNMVALLTEPSCLVVLQCLMQYRPLSSHRRPSSYE